MTVAADGAPGGRARAGEVLRFLAAGAINTAFGYAVYAGLVLLGAAPFLALALATVAGVFFNFFTYGGYAFRQLAARRLPRFLLAYAGIYAFNLLLLESLRAATPLGPLAAQLACLVLVTPAAYLVLKTLVFREEP